MLVSIPVSLLNLVNDLAALILVSGADFLAPFTRAQLDSLAYMFIRLHSQGLYVAQIFWGLWLFPYGLLAIRSGFIPRVVGIALMLAGYGYVANSFTAFFLPKLLHIVSPLSTALEVGEVPIIVWLFLVASRQEAPRVRAPEPVGVAG